jgi:hypothetical protein
MQLFVMTYRHLVILTPGLPDKYYKNDTVPNIFHLLTKVTTFYEIKNDLLFMLITK